MLEIRKGGHRDLERVYNVFEIDFDEKELLPKLGVHLAISKGDAELLIVYDEESKIEVAYALCLCRGLYGYVLLKYISVLPWYREKGVGVQAMRLIHKHYSQVQGILAELTVFDPEDDGSTLRKMQKFFGRFGYEPVDCDYRLAGAPVELRLKNIKGQADVGPVVHRILRDLYSRVLGPTSLERTVQIRKKA